MRSRHRALGHGRAGASLAHLALVVTLTVGALSVAARALAQPWAEVSDRQLKQDVELLHVLGILHGPLLSWPLSWRELTALEHADVSSLPPHVAHALARVRARAAEHAQRHGAELRADVASEPDLLRDFGSGARERVDASAGAFVHARGGFARVGGSYRQAQRGRDVQPDRTLLGYALGDYHVYAGYAEHWWGPGTDGSLVLSNSARPFPKLGVKRMGTSPFASPWLRWIGPYRLEAFVGVLDEKREARNALVVGMRLELEPIHNWEIAFGRVIQLCGRGRPCGAGTWGRALVGVGDVENTGTANEPGNQLASLETRVSANVRGRALSLYGQALAEDEGRFMVYRFAQLWGAQLVFGVGERGASSTVGLEYADTRARDYLVAGALRPSTTYTHSIYRDGFSYGGRPIGFSLDGDSRLGSLSWSITAPEGQRFYAAARYLVINAYDVASYHVSRTKENVTLGEVGAELPIPRGLFRVEARVQHDGPDSPRRSPWTSQVEGGYRLLF